jgi:archaemetzincin
MSAIALAAMGEVPPAVLDRIERALVAAYRLPLARLAPLGEPEGAYSPARGQWSSAEFLKALLRERPPQAARLIGITERDLFVPVLSFVYGQAQLEGPVAVVSLARLRPEFHGLRPDPPTLARRAATEAVHEIGHTFGLVHCPDRRCPMSLSIDLGELDRKAAEPCLACTSLVEGSREMKLSRAATRGDRT